jgi:N-acetyl-gamma-glutamyl-phosphate reductase
MVKKIPVSIIGATGYTGQELVKILINHPFVEIKHITSRQNTGVFYEDLFPFFKGKIHLKLSKINLTKVAKDSKIAFLCLPHHEAMNTAASLIKKGIKVVDLSADFRLNDASLYEDWYGPHSQKKLIKKAVYGLVELNRAKIKKANLIATPGCYPTSCILGLAPITEEKIIDPNSVIIDAKSGVTGAGRSAKIELLYSEVNENLKAYKVGAHRHTPEINQELTKLYGESVNTIFTPHLIPINRGILSTIYVKLTKKLTGKKILEIYKKFYQPDKFVQVLKEKELPEIASVAKTNFCQIGLVYNERTNQLIIVSVIDNLIKGASGQAVQCFNLMNNFDETTGLI